MSSQARISTPVYLDPKNGPYCGSCLLCDAEEFNPSGLGICTKKGSVVNVRKQTDCIEYQPKTKEQ